LMLIRRAEFWCSYFTEHALISPWRWRW
jgi:hypothetical protein